MAIYQFRKGTRAAGIKPDTAAKELGRIYEKHGKLSPTVVVDEARPAESPLHPAFEWDDSKAAEFYRRSQAKDLIYSVEIIEESQPIPQRIYTYIPSVEAYIPTQVVVSDVDLYVEAREEFAKRFNEALCSLQRFERIARSNRMKATAKLLGAAANAMTKVQRDLSKGLLQR